MSSPQILTNPKFYPSAPSSPSLFNLDNNVCFYSVPTSPSRGSQPKSTHYFETEPTTTTPTTKNEDGFNSNLEDFEFETSRRFNVGHDNYDYEFETSQTEYTEEDDQLEKDDQRRQFKASLPAMAFADELFCDGKVMPLKPPPRFQNCGNNDESSFCIAQKLSSNPPSPRSPNSKLRLPFTRRSLWNDDFDPFLVALEHVKEDKRRDNLQGNKKKHRRALSMFACMSQQSNDMILGPDHKACKEFSLSMRIPHKQIMEPNDPETKGVTKSPIRLAEPKGVLFARRARLVKMVNEWPKKHNTTTHSYQEFMLEARNRCNESGGSWNNREDNKRQRKRGFLFKSLSMRKTNDESWKQLDDRHQNVELPQAKFTRKLSLKSMKLVHCKEEKGESKIRDENVEKDQNFVPPKSKIGMKLSFDSKGLGHYKEDKVSEVSKITPAQQRPRLLMCIGLNAKYVK